MVNREATLQSHQLSESQLQKWQERFNEGYKANGSMDLDDFTDKVNELLQMIWETDDDNARTPKFSIEEPTRNDPDDLYLPLVTFDVLSRVPSASHKGNDPIYFGSFPDPTNPHRMVKLFRQWFDTEVEFRVHHETNREARVLMEEFEMFLHEYKGHFKELGLSDIRFLNEAKPEVVTRFQRAIPVRVLRYLVRIERITTTRSNILANVTSTRQDGKADVVYNDSPLMQSYRSQLRIED